MLTFFRLLLMLLIVSVLVFSCSSNNLTNELDNWCDCEKSAIDNTKFLDSCNQMMIDISLKYEFDPESVPLIQNKVRNCR